MSARSAVARVLLGLALTALAGCAGMPGHSACAFFPGDQTCSRLPVSADGNGAEIATAHYFAHDGDSAYEQRFQALLAQSRIDALDRANGTGRFGRDYDYAPAELKPVIMTVAKLQHAARRKGKRIGGAS